MSLELSITSTYIGAGLVFSFLSSKFYDIYKQEKQDNNLNANSLMHYFLTFLSLLMVYAAINTTSMIIDVNNTTNAWDSVLSFTNVIISAVTWIYLTIGFIFLIKKMVIDSMTAGFKWLQKSYGGGYKRR